MIICPHVRQTTWVASFEQHSAPPPRHPPRPPFAAMRGGLLAGQNWCLSTPSSLKAGMCNCAVEIAEPLSPLQCESG